MTGRISFFRVLVVIVLVVICFNSTHLLYSNNNTPTDLPIISPSSSSTDALQENKDSSQYWFQSLYQTYPQSPDQSSGQSSHQSSQPSPQSQSSGQSSSQSSHQSSHQSSQPSPQSSGQQSSPQSSGQSSSQSSSQSSHQSSQPSPQSISQIPSVPAVPGYYPTKFYYNIIDWLGGYGGPQPGLNIERQEFCGTIERSYHFSKMTNGTLVLPKWTVGVGSTEKYLFDQIVDIELFNSRIRPGPLFGVAEVPKDTKLYVLEITKQELIDRVGDYRYDQNLNNVLITSLMTIPKKIKDVIKGLTDKMGPFACIHLRTEKDFGDYFHKNPAYYTEVQIYDKLRAHFTRKYKGPRPPTLYIAGNHPDWEEKIVFFNMSGLWSQVVTKESLNVSAIFTSRQFPTTLGATVDQEVCRMADMFIGNNHSSWSELLAFFIRYERKIAPENLLQVNDMNLHIPTDELFPFCGANDLARLNVTCNYVRLW